jgi:hypothetical protein
MKTGKERRFAHWLGTTAITIALAVLAYGVVVGTEENSAEAAAAPACKTFTTEEACKAREDCSWVKASIDAKTGKEKRKAYCRNKPKPKPKPKDKSKT